MLTGCGEWAGVYIMLNDGRVINFHQPIISNFMRIIYIYIYLFFIFLVSCEIIEMTIFFYVKISGKNLLIGPYKDFVPKLRLTV